ncbi:MAG: restriction endonuclease subunit S, partial [Anaerolineales bacterium]|nr:restriction endonuclease subunit S [Anaerolineales bacterium]
MKPYPAYKDSGVEWIGKIPEHWEISPLKFQSEINRESLPEITDPDLLMSYIDIGNVNGNGLISPPKVMRFGDSPSRARRIIQESDSIISTVRTYLKAIAYFPKTQNNLIVSTGFATITPSESIHPKYMHYAISSEKFIDSVSSRSTGVSYPAITSTELGSIPIWIPSISEQRIIANFLDQKTSLIDRAIAARERKIKLLQEYRTALINQAVTKGLDPDVPMKDSGIEWLGEIPAHWEASSARYYYDIKLGKMLNSSKQNGEGIRKKYLRAANIHWNKVLVDDYMVNEMEFTENQFIRYRLQEDDLLITEG